MCLLVEWQNAIYSCEKVKFDKTCHIFTISIEVFSIKSSILFLVVVAFSSIRIHMHVMKTISLTANTHGKKQSRGRSRARGAQSRGKSEKNPNERQVCRANLWLAFNVMHISTGIFGQNIVIYYTIQLHLNLNMPLYSATTCACSWCNTKAHTRNG